MGKNRQSWLLTGVLIFALLGAGYFFGIKAQSTKASKVTAQTAVQTNANAKLRGEIAVLQQQASGVIAQQKRLRQIASIIPSNPALPRLVRSLSALSQAAGVSLTGVAPGPVVASGAAQAQPAQAGPATAGAVSPKAAPAAVVAADLLEMPVTLALTGDFTALQLFLSKLEKLDRAYVVESLSVTPAGDSPAAGQVGIKKKAANELNVTITGQVFMKVAALPTAAPVKAPAANTEK